MDLILERLSSKYYRSEDQMWSDMDLITHCSKVYNGEKSELTHEIRLFIEKLRKELKQYISCNKEKNFYKKKPDNSIVAFSK